MTTIREVEAMTVYRLFDAAGTLLYVGITRRDRVQRRMTEHKYGKPWWGDVDSARTVLVDRDGRDEAALTEQEAIIIERPLYNQADRAIRTTVERDAVGSEYIPAARTERARRFLAVVGATT